VKRHPALVPLSHDHHHGLVQAKRLRAGARADDGRAVASTFLRFFAEETMRHFREEEELLFPLLADSEEAREPLVHVLLEHQHLHALAGRLAAQVEAGAPTEELMVELGQVLEGHIRYEERQLFPLIEQLVPDLEPLSPLNAADNERSATIGDLSMIAGEGPVWSANSEDLNATLLVWGGGHETPYHVNEERDVLIVVLAGSADIALGSRSETVRSGQALLVPKGEPRQIVAGGKGVRYLSVHRRRPPLQIAPFQPRES
jgi:mannose-6-phosphate isomerase-like protein (cupin superfamily)